MIGKYAAENGPTSAAKHYTEETKFRQIKIQTSFRQIKISPIVNFQLIAKH